MKWHFGCGRRRVKGWRNTDAEIDLRQPLPWADKSCEVAVGQQVFEHLHLEQHGIPFLRELRRVIRPGGHLWLAVPDMRKICKAYLDGTLNDLLAARQQRWPRFTLMDAPELNADIPLCHLVNWFFYSKKLHENLFDFDLLGWALEKGGWSHVEESTEAALIAEHQWPPRNDNESSLYVRAT